MATPSRIPASASEPMRLNECIITVRPEPTHRPNLILSQDVRVGEVRIKAELEAGFSIKLWDANVDTSEAWTTLDENLDDGFHYELVTTGWDTDNAQVRLKVLRFKNGEPDGFEWPADGTRAMLTLGSKYQVIDHHPLREEDAGVVEVDGTDRLASRIWIHAHGRLTAFALTSH